MNDKEYAAGLPETPGYRYAERVGPQLFVSGQVPHDSEGKIVGIGDSAHQTRQCLSNLVTLLRVHGFESSDIRKLTVYVVGSQDNLDKAWSRVTEWFENDVPPATLLGVARLGYEDQIAEIDAVVIKK